MGRIVSKKKIKLNKRREKVDPTFERIIVNIKKN